MKFDELIHELECDYGRIDFRERLMLRRAYDVMPEKEEIEHVCHKVDKWDSEHRFYAFQNIGEISKNIWHIDESEDGRYPKCNVIKWFKTREDVEYYLRNLKSDKELEKENEQLRKDLEELTFTNEYQRVISDKNEYISVLESENAELKADGPKWYTPDKKLPEECTTVVAYGFDDVEPTTFHFVCSDQWEWLPRRIAVLSNEQIKKWCNIPGE